MSATVRSTPLDPLSGLWPRIAPEDFVDCYSVKADLRPRQAAEIIAEFPGWVRFLVALRGIALAPFGIKARGPKAPDKIGEFPVESETDDEVIAGFNDRHLDFRISVSARDGEVALATWVHKRNLGGRIYLAVIMPFHIIIARNALARVARRSNAGKT